MGNELARKILQAENISTISQMSFFQQMMLNLTNIEAKKTLAVEMRFEPVTGDGHHTAFPVRVLNGTTKTRNHSNNLPFSQVNQWKLNSSYVMSSKLRNVVIFWHLEEKTKNDSIKFLDLVNQKKGLTFG